jgi:hypothetical protein
VPGSEEEGTGEGDACARDACSSQGRTRHAGTRSNPSAGHGSQRRGLSSR